MKGSRYQGFLLSVAVILVSLAPASADRARVEISCTAQSICSTHGRLMENVLTPIPPEQLKTGMELIQYCAGENHPLAQFSLAYAYESGNGVEKDRKRAFDLYVKSALGGSTAAMGMLVDYYNGAMGPGNPYDPTECTAWARVAGMLGDSRTAERESFCAASKQAGIDGQKRALELLKKVRENANPNRFSSCR